MSGVSFALTVLMPGAFAAACFLAPVVIRSWKPAAGLTGALHVLGAGLPFILAAGFVLGGWPAFPPRQAAEFTPFLALGATFAGVLLAPSMQKGEWSWLRGVFAAAVFSAAVLVFPLRRAVEMQMGNGWGIERAALMLLAGGAIAVPAVGAAIVASTARGPAPGVGLAVSFGISAVAIVLCASAKLGQLESLLIAGAAGSIAAGVVRRKSVSLGAAACGVLVAMHATIWLLARFYAEATPVVFWLGALSPLGLLVLLVPRVDRGPAWGRCLIAAGACGAPAAIAGFIASQRYSVSPLPF